LGLEPNVLWGLLLAPQGGSDLYPKMPVLMEHRLCEALLPFGKGPVPLSWACAPKRLPFEFWLCARFVGS